MMKHLYLAAFALAVCGVAVGAEQSAPTTSSSSSGTFYAYSPSDEEYSSNEDPELKTEAELSSKNQKKSRGQSRWFSPRVGEMRNSQ